MTLLLDPRLLIPPGRPDGQLDTAVEFWKRLLDWAADGRVLIGEESHRLLCELFAEYGYPDQDLTLQVPALKREYQAALSRMLGRVALHTEESSECTFDPCYMGSEAQDLALQMDITGTAGSGVRGLGTDVNHWADTSPTLVIRPGPPNELMLCAAPGQQLPHEVFSLAARFFHGKKVKIVGGQRDGVVIKRLNTELGIEAAAVEWIACEKAKPPRNLDLTWGGLDPDRDITVCITGRVGHATSMAAKAAALKRGALHLQVEYASEVVKELKLLVGMWR